MISRDELIDRKLFKEFSTTNNSLASKDMLLRAILHIGCIALSYNYLSDGHFWLAILAAIPHFIAFSFLGWAGIGHELFHGTVFSNRTFNIFLFKAFSVLTWSNYGYFEVTHWKHHKETLLADDPEGNPSQGLKASDFVWFFTFDFPGFLRRLKVLGLNALGIVPGPLAQTLFKQGSQQRVILVKAARIILAFHVGLAALFVLTRTEYLIVLVNLAPFFITFFNRLLAVSQHYGTQHVSKPDYLVTTRTVVLDRISSFLYANMNYHVEHHFFPSVPYYNLPRVHDQLRRSLIYNYYAKGLREMFQELKRLGCFKG